MTTKADVSKAARKVSALRRQKKEVTARLTRRHILNSPGGKLKLEIVDFKIKQAEHRHQHLKRMLEMQK